MKKLTCVFCIGVLLILVLQAERLLAEDTYILAAGMKLALGMDREVVLNKLRIKYKVDRNRFEGFGDDAWFIHDPKTNEIIAQVSFDNAGVKWASHTWRVFYEKDNSFSMARSIFALISNITKSESKAVLVSSKTSRGAEFTLEELEFTFENRMVTITIIQGDKQKTTQIVESVFR